MLILIGFKDWMFGTLDILILEKLLVYESYIERKIMKRTLTTKKHRVKKCLELVHTNVCRPFSVHAQEGYGYFITFINEYSRFGYVYLMHK